MSDDGGIPGWTVRTRCIARGSDALQYFLVSSLRGKRERGHQARAVCRAACCDGFVVEGLSQGEVGVVVRYVAQGYEQVRVFREVCGYRTCECFGCAVRFVE